MTEIRRITDEDGEQRREFTPADVEFGRPFVLDGVARQLHDEDPVVFHGSEGGKDCPACGSVRPDDD